MMQVPTVNWSGSFNYSFRECLRPSSLDELREAVSSSPHIKVLGSRHSFNAIADGDVALVLDRLPLDPIVADDRASVTIAGHATYGELAGFLGGHGLAVHNLASLPHISIAGAIATATHGSGIGNGNLATAVGGIEFVTSDGSLVTSRRGEAGFEGMIVHLGLLGVVTRVTLDLRPAYEIAQTVYEGLNWQATCDGLETIMSAGYSVSIFTTWSDGGNQAWVKAAGPFGDPPGEIFGARPARVKRHPIPEVGAENTTDQMSLPGRWSDRLPHFRMGFTPSSGNEIQSEFHVPRRHGAAAIEALLAIRDRFAHLVQVTEFRMVAADRLWLSPQFERDTLSLHFTWHPDGPGVEAAARVIEDALAPFDALPHWGKVFSPAHIGGRYRMLSQFAEIRERMDPVRKFSNPWLEQVVFGAG